MASTAPRLLGCSVQVAPASVLVAVSYTHLDVYKRQCQNGAACGCSRRISVGSLADRGLATQRSTSSRLRPVSAAAVSYTHLDVYKRQVGGRPPRPRHTTASDRFLEEQRHRLLHGRHRVPGRAVITVEGAVEQPVPERRGMWVLSLIHI